MEAAARHERVGLRIIRKYLHWNTLSIMVIIYCILYYVQLLILLLLLLLYANVLHRRTRAH